MFKNRGTRVWLVMVLVLAATACAYVKAPTPVPIPTAIVAPTAAPVPANELEAQIQAVDRQAGPAVVLITSIITASSSSTQAGPGQSTGSGFIYDTQGHVVTNYHVVEGAAAVFLAFVNGDVHEATIVGTDPSTDLAVLRVVDPNLPTPLALGDSSQLRVGQFVIAIGNPFGLDHTLTLGIVSALQRVILSPSGRFIGQVVQTDAAINPGNSGGPLLNLAGQVIGVNSQIVGSTGSNVGIGFAIASNTVSQVAPALIANGHYAHPWIGVSLLDLSPDAAAVFQQAGAPVPVEKGMLILTVVPGSPAAQAGIRGGSRVVSIGGVDFPVGGDIITAVNGKAMPGNEDLVLYLDGETHVGDTVQVALLRDGKEMTVSVKLGELPPQ